MDLYGHLEAPRSPKQLALFGEALGWAFNRLGEMYRTGDITSLGAEGSVINVSYTYTSWNRCGDSSTEETHYAIPLEIFFSDTNLCAWADQKDRNVIEEQRRKAEEEKQRLEREAVARKAKAEATKRDRDWAEYNRLKAQFQTEE